MMDPAQRSCSPSAGRQWTPRARCRIGMPSLARVWMPGHRLMSSANLVPSKLEYPMGGRSLVCVVDDDESVRESLPELLKSFGFSVEAFSSAEEFLTSDAAVRTSCLIL